MYDRAARLLTCSSNSTSPNVGPGTYNHVAKSKERRGRLSELASYVVYNCSRNVFLNLVYSACYFVHTLKCIQNIL